MCEENIDESTAVKVPKLGKFSPGAFTLILRYLILVF